MPLDNNVVVPVSIGGDTVRLALWERDDDRFDGVRMLLYPGTDAIILCFSVVNRWDLENVEDK
ncbi:hypothetical protein HK405_011005, partial [Cladochytrium tenue]